MPFVTVPTESAIRVVRPKGSSVTFLNQSAVDVYFDSEPQRLNSSAQGAIPSGSRLSANGGEKSFDNFPGSMWFRSSTYTSIEVQP